MSRTHTNDVTLGLARRYGRVKVIQHGGTDECVEACWDYGKPERCCCASAPAQAEITDPVNRTHLLSAAVAPAELYRFRRASRTSSTYPDELTSV